LEPFPRPRLSSFTRQEFDSGYCDESIISGLSPIRTETPENHGDHEGVCHPIGHINMPVGLEGLETPREEFLDKVFGENEAFTSPSPTTLTDSGDSSNRSQSNTIPPSSLTSTTDSSQEIGKSFKRKRNNSKEEEGSPPDRPRKQGRTGPSDKYGQECHRSRRLACHFYLFQKDIYYKNNRTGKRYETYSGPGWQTIYHLK
jgi:hypothetical protein